MLLRLSNMRFTLCLAVISFVGITLTVIAHLQSTSGLSAETLFDNWFNTEAKSQPNQILDIGLSSADNSVKERVFESYGQLPLHFEPNNGQIKSEQVKFSSRGQGYQLFLTPTSATLALRESNNRKVDIKPTFAIAKIKQLSQQKKPDINTDKQTIVEMQIVGANKDAQFSGKEELESKSNYFIGNDESQWKTDVANYKRVRFDEVYSGISLEYYGNQRQLEYDFIIEPHADPRQIKLNYKGVEKITVNEFGELIMKTTSNEVIQKKPFVFQTDENGEKKEIASSYNVNGKVVSFQLADYDKNKELIIDPVVLVYSTFLGGSGFDTGFAVAVDNQSSAYVVGFTQSLNFPIQGALQTTNNGNFDAFVCKFNAAGNQLIYSTYLGGSGNEFQTGTRASITVDSSGNAYITGATNSGTTGTTSFPTTSGSFQQNFGGGLSDSFITKLNPSGNQIIFSTYLGGDGYDFLGDIKVDVNNNVYVVGTGYSRNMPSTPGVIQPALACNRPDTPIDRFFCNDIYLAKFNPNGNQLIYFTYLGNTDGPDFGSKLAIDASGNAYITGETTYRPGPGPNFEVTNNSDFPTTAGVVQRNFRGNSDAYAVKINSTATSIIFSTFLGGSIINGLNTGYDFGADIAIDSNNNVYITGGTTSSDFPLANAIQPTYGGGNNDVFVTKLNPTGNAFLFSTYLGGSGYDDYPRMAVDNSGDIYLTGQTSSHNFPQVQSRQTTLGGAMDAFVTKLSSSGNQILYSTYHGGSSIDYGLGIAVDNLGNAYVTGATHSDQNFPTVNPLQANSSGFYDAFVSKFMSPMAQTYNLSGRISNNVNGAGGVIVNLSGGITARAVTDANGFYIFNDLPPNNYVISPVLENANFDFPSRAVTISNSSQIVDFTFTVCSVQLTSTERTVSSNGIFDGSLSFTITGCPRNIKSNVPWLIVTSGETGNGSGSIGYVVQRNFGPARSGIITINGQTFMVNQQASTQNAKTTNGLTGICDTEVVFSQNRLIIPHTGGSNTFTVNMPSSCGAWSVADDSSWINITSPTTDNTGTRQVIFTVSALSETTPRSGEISVNGKFFTVIQTPNFPPGWSLREPRSGTFPASGGRGIIQINLGETAVWRTNIPNLRDAEWIKIPDTSGNSSGGVRQTTARFIVLPNLGRTQRTGTVIVGDQNYTVVQDSSLQDLCNYNLSSNSQTLASAINSDGSFQVSVGRGCGWTAISTASWLEITGGSGNGNGTVTFKANSANMGTTARPATIIVGTKTFNVSQNASQQPCSRTINPNSREVAGEGATGIVGLSSSGGCSPISSSSNVPWITPVINNSSQLSYTVQANNSTAPRTGTVQIGEQTFTINQNAGNVRRRTKTFDFEGDERTQISVYRPSNGIWYVLNSQMTFSGTQFGAPTDKIVPADYDGDGKSDLAVFRNGIWYLLRSSAGFTAYQFGLGDDIPQPADYDGDGRAEIAVYRPSNGTWYIFNLFNNKITGFQFGVREDKPVVGDFDGDGRADYAVYRPSNGIWYYQGSTVGFKFQQFGDLNDRPVVGDYDGDGRSDIAVFRPSNGFWYLLNSSNGFTATQFGESNDLPVPGDYDGDGRTDVAVFRPSNGIWYLLNSTNGFSAIQFGLSTDKPAPNAFVP